MKDPMVRICYHGSEPYTSKQMAGVTLTAGTCIDVPQSMAEQLVSLGALFAYSAEPPPIPAVEEPGREEEVAETSLESIRGIGEQRREVLARYGIYSRESLASLTEDDLARLREQIEAEPLLTMSLLRRWRIQAQDV